MALHRHTIKACISHERRLSREAALQQLAAREQYVKNAAQRAFNRAGLIRLGLLAPASILSKGAGFGK